MRRYVQSKSFKTLIIFFLFFASVKSEAIKSFSRIDEDEEKTLEQKLIESNVAISKWFESLAEGIDLFLVDKQLQYVQNETNVKIENLTYLVEGKGATNETNLVLNPRFPNLEKYWNLKFTTYDDQSDERGIDKDYLRQAPREKNYGATIGLFSKFGKIRAAFQPRIELRSPLTVSHSLTFETVADYKTYQINPKLEFFAHSTKGTGIFQALNFNFILTNEYSLTLINEGTYEEKLNKFSVIHGFSIGQAISQNDAMTYGFFTFSNNRDNYHLDSYSFSTSWYHLLYKKILDTQLTPHLDFTRAESFKGQLGLTLQVTLNF